MKHTCIKMLGRVRILCSKTSRKTRMTEDINKCLESGVEIECGILRKRANLASENSVIRD